MIATSFDESNCVIGKPEDMPHDECDCLSVFVGRQAGDTPVVISCWKLTKEEFEEVKRTGRIWLGVLGKTMPPVWLSGCSPFEKRNS